MAVLNTWSEYSNADNPRDPELTFKFKIHNDMPGEVTQVVTIAWPGERLALATEYDRPRDRRRK